MSKSDNQPNLIVMLTYNDKTVADAYSIFEECKDCSVQYWGFKEENLPLPEMKKLFAYIKSLGKTAVLEVVAYTEEKCLEGAEMAHECGVDILMGTVYSDKINDYCRENGLLYMPFVGDVYDRPSVLGGSIDGMIDEAKELLKKGVYGFDLLAYRFTGDAGELIRRFVSEIDAPVCLAGSVDSYEKIDEILDVSPWAFTIGSAFFDNCFGGRFSQQINSVCKYLENSPVKV